MKNIISVFINVVIIFVFVSTSVFSQEDLSIRYIQRLPEIEYVQNSSNPAVQGWPTVGQQVTWSAKVKHWGTSTVTVNYRWYINGTEVGAGSRQISGGTEIDIDYVQNWTFDRKELKLVVDSENYFTETEEGNNEVTVFTDAISAGFYIEQGLYDYFHQHQNRLGVGSNNFEDWAHRQVEIWNDMLADAVTADTPNGVLDRIRLDKITVVPDNGLPLAGGSEGYPTNKPAVDKTVDLIWGFPTDHYLNLGTFGNHTQATLSNPFYFDRGLFHELGHARYLIDVYGFNIEYENGQSIDIKENGVDIDDAGLFPSPYRTDMAGLMNNSGDYTEIDTYSAMALNLIAGHRALCGNSNPPCNLGDRAGQFMQDFPTQNRVLIIGENGLPVVGANIQIYQSASGSDEWYGERYDNIADLSFTSDAQGYINVGTNPFSDNDIVHTFGYSNGTVIVRAEKAGNVGYTALHSWQFNMEYWRGNTNLGTYQLAFDNIVGSAVNPCPSNRNITAHSSSNAYLEAANTITSSAVVVANGDITYDAGTRVRLTTGFHARTNSSFHAFIDGCANDNIPDVKEELEDAPLTIRNYPNPFTGQTTIEFTLSKDTPVTLFVSDVTGRQMAVLLDHEQKTQGTHLMTFDGSKYAAGMYYYTIQAGEYTGTQKMILAK